MNASKLALALALAGATLLMPQSSSASLIFDSNVLLSAQGFGNAPKDLTVHATGQDNTQSGCVGVNGSGGIVIGPTACITNGQVFDSNGIANTGGQEPNPQVDDNKYGIPTLGSLGITTAAQIGILFNATEAQNDDGTINVTDLTLKFYTPTGNLLGAIDGSHNFGSTNPGLGVAGFVFVVSNDELAYVNGLINPNVVLALESTQTNFSGGNDTFQIVNIRPTNVPEPMTLALLGGGLLGLALARRRK